MDLINSFNDVFENNEETLYMEKSGSYNIDKNIVNEYINNNCIPNIDTLLHFIYKNIIYVTFDDFLNSIKRYLFEIISLHDGAKIVIILPGLLGSTIAKSNYWIALIIKKLIVGKNVEIVNIVNNITEFSKYIQSIDDNENYIGIFPDDCAYSGKQSGDELFKIPYNLNNKIYVLIPYISTYAYDIYKKKCKKTYKINTFPQNIIILENKIRFIKSFIDICVEQNFNIFKYNIYYLTNEQYNKKILNQHYKINSFIEDILLLPVCGILIYFDHKIADQASTIQYFLNYSIVLNDVYVLNIPNNIYDQCFQDLVNKYSKINTIGNDYIYIILNSLYDNSNDLIKYNCNIKKKYYKVISGCDHIPYLPIPDQMDLPMVDLNKEFYDGVNSYACPSTFYKQKDFYKKYKSKYLALKHA